MDRRQFLTIAGALALAPAANAAVALDAKAERTAPSGVRLDWTGAGAVSVLVSPDPDARKAAMRPLKTAAGTSVSVEAPVSPRPYFLVSAADGRQTRVAERLLPLEGGRNFRDLGGWRVAGGQQVKWGKIYRSGVMAGLTLADMEYLKALGVLTICDLRSPQERASEPNPFLNTPGPKVLATDYDMSASMAALMTMKTREDALQGFADAYVGFLDMLTPHYTDMFARLVANEGPLAFNCSAGKDRTGMASALILSVLGAPRATVLQDYALTQVYTPPSYYAKMAQSGGGGASVTAQQMQALAKLPPEVLQVIMGSDPEVMRRALAIIDAKHGGPVALTKSRFGLTDQKIAAMRKAYLT
ncbi:tyrosine-protein phosphatase [Caulobacter sp.]|uniref:tyrosine-protein phosphatase n=1 Tax=Caulobacter sp. TaxID=78 RepID=UPI002B47C7A3|nr:tyrosine-protein phosphatase [Caulobacter sp.]HJV43587.1 tyrosine-protein phosphatase [Caulobacter sp.]